MQRQKDSEIQLSGLQFFKSVCRWSSSEQPTNEDEGEADAEGQDVSTERLVVLPVTLRKNTQTWVDFVFTKSLESKGGISKNVFICSFRERNLTLELWFWGKTFSGSVGSGRARMDGDENTGLCQICSTIM